MVMEVIVVQVHRRQLLAGLSVLALPLAARVAIAQGADAATIFIVLKGLEAQPDQELTKSILDSFNTQTIPVSVIVDLSDETRISPDTATHVRAILSVAVDHKGLVEPVIGHIALHAAHRYLHLRAATKQRDLLAGLMNAVAADVEDVVSLYDLSEDDTLEPFAYRSAGFRVLISPDAQATSAGVTIMQPLGWGILRIRGGIHHALGDDPTGAINTMTQTDGPHLLVLDASQSPRGADRWVAALNDVFGRGQVIPSRPSDYMLLGNPGASKMMALAFDLGNAQDPSEDILDFANLLDEIDVPYSFIGPARPDGSNPAAGFCATQPSALGVQSGQGEACLSRRARTPPIAESVGAEIIVSPHSSEWAALGPHEDGRFYMPDNADPETLLLERLQSRPLADGIAIVTAKDIGTRFKRISLQRAIQAAKINGQINFHTLTSMRDALAAPDPVLDHFWSTRRRFAAPLPAAATLAGPERAALLEDANLAWSYIARHTRDDTGLCPGTAQGGSGTSVISNAVTLWDVASQVNGIIAAQNLDLIEVADAQRRIKQLLDALPTITIDGYRLPPALFNAATLRPLRSGYDACDTGRFLIALARAEAVGLVSAIDTQVLLSSWDLGPTIRQAHPYSYTQRGWQDTFASHCTHYIRHGFAYAGLTVDTPYPSLTTKATGDDRIALLYRSAELGHVGPEPALLEVVEGLQSPEARYLADVLFDAQLRYFEETGKYRAVSEVPINAAPWFVYQGLRVDLPQSRCWIIKSTLSSSNTTSDAGLENKRMISTKAVFLSAATYPHPYCTELLALVRDRAKLPGFGYASGLREDDLTPMEGYSDLNTNGIILTAIDYMLR